MCGADAGAARHGGDRGVDQRGCYGAIMLRVSADYPGTWAASARASPLADIHALAAATGTPTPSPRRAGPHLVQHVDGLDLRRSQVQIGHDVRFEFARWVQISGSYGQNRSKTRHFRTTSATTP
jgi:hypothetical protein